MSEIFEKVTDAILDYAEPDGELSADSTLRGDCGLASFDLTCLINDLNALFGKSLDASTIRKCDTVGDLAAAYAENGD